MTAKKKSRNAKSRAVSLPGENALPKETPAAALPAEEETSVPARKERSFDFVNRRRWWYLLSLLVIIPGLFALGFKGLNLGIDFEGGSLIHVRFQNAVDTAEVRQALNEFGLEKAPVIQSTGENEFILRTEELSEERNGQLLAFLQQKLGSLSILRNEKVGAVIGGELTRKAAYSLIIAAILILLYITFRFEFRSGVAAVLALIHDALVVLGVFAIFQIEVDSSFIAAILTILGYSINDTIVIFDRIRENRKNYPRMDMAELVNRSINQTLARSINTVLTVIFCLVAILIFGGQTTKIFALAMLIGVISGAYSSIFVASPLWVDFLRWQKGKRKAFAGARG